MTPAEFYFNEWQKLNANTNAARCEWFKAWQHEFLHFVNTCGRVNGSKSHDTMSVVSTEPLPAYLQPPDDAGGRRNWHVVARTPDGLVYLRVHRGFGTCEIELSPIRVHENQKAPTPLGEVKLDILPVLVEEQRRVVKTAQHTAEQATYNLGGEVKKLLELEQRAAVARIVLRKEE